LGWAAQAGTWGRISPRGRAITAREGRRGPRRVVHRPRPAGPLGGRLPRRRPRRGGGRLRRRRPRRWGVGARAGPPRRPADGLALRPHGRRGAPPPGLRTGAAAGVPP